MNHVPWRYKLIVLSFALLLTMQFLTRGIKTLDEYTWNYIGNNKQNVKF